MKIKTTVLSLSALALTAALAAGQPVITTVNPFSVHAGTATFTLNVYGSGFYPTMTGIAGSVVKWNFMNLPTTFVSGSHLRATVNYTLIANPGTSLVTVYNAGIYPGTSLPTGVWVTPPLSVGISHLSPSSAPAGSPGFCLYVYGNGFQASSFFPLIAGSVVTWNGTALITTYASPSLLIATVPSSLLATAGNAQIRVENRYFPKSTPISISNVVNFAITP